MAGLPPVTTVVNGTVAAPSLNALPVPTLTAVPIVGESGVSCIGEDKSLTPRCLLSVMSLPPCLYREINMGAKLLLERSAFIFAV